MNRESVKDGWRKTENETVKLLKGHEMKRQYNRTAQQSLLNLKYDLLSQCIAFPPAALLHCNAKV